MLSDVEIEWSAIIIIESDNCTSQCKPFAYFLGMQTVPNKLNVTLTRKCGIPERRKGEVDHADSIAKNTIRQQIAIIDFYSTGRF